MPGSGLRPLPHDEAARTEFHEIRERDVNFTINVLYMTAKRDLLRLGAPVDEPMRRKLYGDIRRRLLERASPVDPVSITVSFRRTTTEPGLIDAQLVYNVTPTPEGSPERQAFLGARTAR